MGRINRRRRKYQAAKPHLQGVDDNAFHLQALREAARNAGRRGSRTPATLSTLERNGNSVVTKKNRCQRLTPNL
jgi:anti-sigma factor RsiW